MSAVSSNQIAPTVLLFNPSRGDNLDRMGKWFNLLCGVVLILRLAPIEISVTFSQAATMIVPAGYNLVGYLIARVNFLCSLLTSY